MSEALWLVALVLLIIIIGIFVILVVARMLGLRRVTVLEYQRGLKYVNGRYVATVGPGLYRTLTWRTQITLVDVRVTYVTIPGQEMPTADGVTVKMSLVSAYEVADPNTAINKNVSYATAIYLLLQMGLREIVAGEKIEALLEGRAEVGKRMLENLGPKAAELGLRLISVEVKDLMLPGDIKKVFSQVVKAQKEGLAALEKARGETAALRSLANAAKMIEDNPNLLQLRALQAFGESNGNTLFFGVPQAAAVAARKNGTEEKS